MLSSRGGGCLTGALAAKTTDSYKNLAVQVGQGVGVGVEVEVGI